MFKKILVPLDGWALAEQALGQAAAIARASHAAIDLIAVEAPFPFGGFTDAKWTVAEREELHRYLEATAAELGSGAGVNVTHIVTTGDPVASICQRAREAPADLVVMTSHGRTGFSRAWLGSVADGVLRHSATPVLMLRPIENKPRSLAAHHLFTHILVPVDDSLSPEVLPAASMLARCSGARLTLLRVVVPAPQVVAQPGLPYARVPLPVDDVATRVLEERARDGLMVVARGAREQTGLEVEEQVIVDSSIGRAIIDYARNHGVDAIAVSSHGRGASRLVMGSVTDKVLRGSELPMLVYRPPKPRTSGDA